MFVVYYLCANALQRMFADFYVLGREVFLMNTCLGFIHITASTNLSISILAEEVYLLHNMTHMEIE